MASLLFPEKQHFPSLLSSSPTVTGVERTLEPGSPETHLVSVPELVGRVAFLSSVSDSLYNTGKCLCAGFCGERTGDTEELPGPPTASLRDAAAAGLSGLVLAASFFPLSQIVSFSFPMAPVAQNRDQTIAKSTYPGGSIETAYNLTFWGKQCHQLNTGASEAMTERFG